MTETIANPQAEVYAVEAVLRRRESDGRLLVRWFGHPAIENTWEPPENLPEAMVAKVGAPSEREVPAVMRERAISKKRVALSAPRVGGK